MPDSDGLPVSNTVDVIFILALVALYGTTRWLIVALGHLEGGA